MTPRARVLPIMTQFGPFINYCYLLVDEDAGEAALIDPSWNIDRIEQPLAQLGVRLRYVLVTHAHVDHTNLARHFSERFAATLVISAAEHAVSGFGGPHDHYVRDGELLPLGRGTIECLVTPGHTAGSTCFRWQGNLFTGDTLFMDGVGLCESVTAASQLYDSVRRIKTEVEPTTRLYAGHSYHVANGITLQFASTTNIYLQIDSRDAFCQFRMRPGQKNLFSFTALACEKA